MAHSPLACHVMEKNHQAATNAIEIYAIIMGLNKGMDKLFKEAKQIEQRITSVKMLHIQRRTEKIGPRRK